MTVEAGSGEVKDCFLVEVVFRQCPPYHVDELATDVLLPREGDFRKERSIDIVLVEALGPDCGCPFYDCLDLRILKDVADTRVHLVGLEVEMEGIEIEKSQ